MFVIELQLKRHNGDGNHFGDYSTSQLPKDVPFVRGFWWEIYGLGAVSSGQSKENAVPGPVEISGERSQVPHSR